MSACTLHSNASVMLISSHVDLCMYVSVQMNYVCVQYVCVQYVCVQCVCVQYVCVQYVCKLVDVGWIKIIGSSTTCTLQLTLHGSPASQLIS